jgi:hypothetical protein
VIEQQPQTLESHLSSDKEDGNEPLIEIQDVTPMDVNPMDSTPMNTMNTMDVNPMDLNNS